MNLDFSRHATGLKALGLGYAGGINRYIAVIGNYALHAIDRDSGCFAGACATRTAREHEWTGGVRASLPLRLVTPYLIGSLGALHSTVRVEAGRFGEASADDKIFVGGPGFGFDIRLHRFLGFQAESRFMFGTQGYLYNRSMIGLYFRHR